MSAVLLYQNSKSRNALQKLKDFTQPAASVIRNGETVQVKSDDLVIGDSLIVEEENPIPADATIVHYNDFSVNESNRTGESLCCI